MSRLTCKYDGINTLREMCTFDRESDIEADDCLNCEEYCDTMDALGGDCDNCAIQRAFNKLAEYEDLEEQGLLKKYDCAIGDTVYRIDRHNEIYECIVVGIKEVFNTTSYLLHASNDVDIRFHSWIDKCQIGYEFYLTKEEAEQELERMECAKCKE